MSSLDDWKPSLEFGLPVAHFSSSASTCGRPESDSRGRRQDGIEFGAGSLVLEAKIAVKYWLCLVLNNRRPELTSKRLNFEKRRTIVVVDHAKPSDGGDTLLALFPWLFENQSTVFVVVGRQERLEM